MQRSKQVVTLKSKGKMKYGRMFVLMALSAVLVIAATGCGKEDKGKEETTNSDALIGKWISYFASETKVETDTLQFNKGGKGVHSLTNGAPNSTFTWTLKGTALTLVLKDSVPATFDGETIVLKYLEDGYDLYVKEGDKGLDEEANRKNLIGTWIGSERYDDEGTTCMFTYVFGKDGKGTYTDELSSDDGSPSKTVSEPFTWTITGAKLEIKYSKHVNATCYNGKKVLCLLGVKLTKK